MFCLPGEKWTKVTFLVSTISYLRTMLFAFTFSPFYCDSPGAGSGFLLLFFESISIFVESQLSLRAQLPAAAVLD